jgi:hypothetical protein
MLGASRAAAGTGERMASPLPTSPALPSKMGHPQFVGGENPHLRSEMWGTRHPVAAGYFALPLLAMR